MRSPSRQATSQIAGPDVDDPLKVVIITTFDPDDYVYGALRAGATGFLLKNAGPSLLIEAVRAAHDGESLVAPSVTTRLLEAMSLPDASSPSVDSDVELTDREEEILDAVARGLTNAEIAADHMISLGTAKAHVPHLMSKLGARNRVELAIWVYETGRRS